MRMTYAFLAGLLVLANAGTSASADEWADCADTAVSDKAIGACTTLIESAKNQQMTAANLAMAHFNRGAAYSRKKSFVRAVEDYDRAITLNSGFAQAYNGRGVVLALKGQHSQAVQEFDRAIALRPKFADALNNRADALRHLGAFDRAIADLDLLIALHPEFADAYYTRGEVHLDQNNIEPARADILNAIRLDSDGIHHDYGHALISEIERRLATIEPNFGEINERRVALVVGNGAYQKTGLLANPPNDANIIAAALRQAEFERVTIAQDLDRAGMVAALQAFGSQADNADWAVIYFAGHGLEIGGTNYLVPVDASLANDRDVPDEAISLNRVLSAVEGARRLRVVVLDACRNNPFLAQMRTTSATRAIGRGLGRIEPTQATLVAYAAKEGTLAADGTSGNSPFAASLAKRITEAGVEINKVFRFVRSDVLAATDNKQEPFVYGSLPPEDFYFVPPH